MSGSTASTFENDSVGDCLNRARRLRQRGEQRKALLVLREACCQHEGDARLWALYAVQCWRMGRREDGKAAMRQALWLREQAKDVRRAHVLRALLLAMESALAHEVLGASGKKRGRREARRGSGLMPAVVPQTGDQAGFGLG